jgi:hypothetical protein
MDMDYRELPLDTWIVVEHPSAGCVALVSRHGTQREAEAERDRHNEEAHAARYSAFLVVEPVAERMGGRRHSMCAV